MYIEHQITIKDDKGKKMTVDGNANYIKVGNTVLLKGQILKMEPLRTELSTQKTNFLTNQCSIDQNDVNVILKLREQTKMNLFAWIDKRDYNLLKSFKDSRNYYRQLQYGKPIPLSPAGWSISYFTDEDYRRYLDMLDKAPW